MYFLALKIFFDTHIAFKATNTVIFSLFDQKQGFKLGVGKVRSAGQIRPAEVFCPARG